MYSFKFHSWSSCINMFIDVPFRIIKIATFITWVPPSPVLSRPCVRKLRWLCIRLVGNGLRTAGNPMPETDHGKRKHSTHKKVILGMVYNSGLKTWKKQPIIGFLSRNMFKCLSVLKVFSLVRFYKSILSRTSAGWPVAMFLPKQVGKL